VNKNNKAAQVIVALDVDTLSQAQALVDKLYPKINIFKVGAHLFTAFGPQLVDLLHKKGAEVFLDLKYFDIPNTVAQAVRAATQLKVKMLTLHISGGEEMLKQAVKAAKEEAEKINCPPPLLIGVTVLTSQAVNPDSVLTLAETGIACGLDGVVCSVQEAALLRKSIKKDFVIVTPGIRPADACADDQRRTATAAEAVKAGSDFLVIGRPILKSKDPLKTTNEILESMRL
jgi:orotidine-5'-phosphate decarboxylase